MDSLRLRAGGFCCFVIVRPLSPCILPVCFAAFAFANILMFTYQKKKYLDSKIHMLCGLPWFKNGHYIDKG